MSRGVCSIQPLKVRISLLGRRNTSTIPAAIRPSATAAEVEPGSRRRVGGGVSPPVKYSRSERPEGWGREFQQSGSGESNRP